MQTMTDRLAIRLEFEICEDNKYISRCTAIIRGKNDEFISVGISASKWYHVARSRSQHVALNEFAQSLNLSPDNLLDISHVSSDTLFKDKHQLSAETSLIFSDRFHLKSYISSPERLSMRLDRFGSEIIHHCRNALRCEVVLDVEPKFIMGLGTSDIDEVTAVFKQTRTVTYFYDLNESVTHIDNRYSNDDVDDRRKLSIEEKRQLHHELKTYMFSDEKYAEMLLHDQEDQHLWD